MALLALTGIMTQAHALTTNQTFIDEQNSGMNQGWPSCVFVTLLGSPDSKAVQTCKDDALWYQAHMCDNPEFGPLIDVCTKGTIKNYIDNYITS